MILAIDPGNVQSAFVVLDEDLKPVDFGKVDNEELIRRVYAFDFKGEYTHVAIEMIASYGMAVGATVFDTCVYIGRLKEIFKQQYFETKYIYRKDEKMNLCGSMKAKDGNIRQALIDRFGVVGTKKQPGFFYGFKADIWAAMAVGVTFYDLHLKGNS